MLPLYKVPDGPDPLPMGDTSAWRPTTNAQTYGLGPFKWWDDVDPDCHYAKVGYRLFEIDEQLRADCKPHYFVIGYEVAGKMHYALLSLRKQPGDRECPCPYTFVTVQSLTKRQALWAQGKSEAEIVSLILDSVAPKVPAPSSKKSAAKKSNASKQVRWPAGWGADEGWPDANSPLPDGTGKTFGEVAEKAGVNLDGVLRKLGKGEE